MQSNLSLLGLYNYDNTIFDNMAYPTDFTNDDKATLRNNLLADLAEMEVVYPRSDFLKSAIGFWSAKEVITWNRLYAASVLEYNPIENYDRIESSSDITDGSRVHSGKDTTQFSGTDTTTNSGSVAHSGKDTTQFSGTDTTTNSGSVTHSGKDTTQLSGTDTGTNTGSVTVTNSGSDATTHQTAAFNATNLVDSGRESTAYGHATNTQSSESVSVTHGQKEELTHGESVSTSDNISVAHGQKQELTHGENVTTSDNISVSHGQKQELTHGESISEDVEVTHESRIHGNIGVTTSQQMLEQELEVAPKLNIMNIIIESFKNRFCLLVY